MVEEIGLGGVDFILEIELFMLIFTEQDRAIKGRQGRRSRVLNGYTFPVSTPCFPLFFLLVTDLLAQ